MRRALVVVLVVAGAVSLALSCGHDNCPPPPPAPQDFGAVRCDSWPACGDGADPDRVFPDLREGD